MQVSVETTTGLERRMTIDIEAQSIDSKVSERLKETARNIRLPGFRPGKVPISLIKRRFGQDVRTEVTQEVIRKSVFDAVEEHQLKLAGLPTIEPLEELAEGKPLKVSAVFEVYPEVSLQAFDGVTVKKPKTAIADEDVDQMIETLRLQKAQWVVVDRESRLKDRVVIDYLGTLDGEAFEGGSAQDSEIELGAGRMLPDFEQGMLGMSAGDSKDIDVTFPDDYGKEDLQGKQAQFNITMKSVKAPELPELDEAFFSQFGVKGSELGLFKSEVRKNMERELKNAIKNKIKNQVMDGLIELHTVDLPKALVENESKGLRQQMARNLLGDQANEQLIQSIPLDGFKDKAERRVKLGLIVGEIIKQHELQPESERVRSLVEDLSESYEEKEAVVNWYMNNQDELSQIEAVALEDQVVDLVLGQVKVEEEDVSYQEFIKEANNTQAQV